MQQVSQMETFENSRKATQWDLDAVCGIAVMDHWTLHKV